MTACTNHGGKARRVVTAALVGVLSVGTVPMVALAEGAQATADGIEQMATNWYTDVKIDSAKDGKGGTVSNPMEATFTVESGKYLVPTKISNDFTTTSVSTNDYVFVYSTNADGSGQVASSNGKTSTGGYVKPLPADYFSTDAAAGTYYLTIYKKVAGTDDADVSQKTNAIAFVISDGAVASEGVQLDGTLTYKGSAYTADDMTFVDADGNEVEPEGDVKFYSPKGGTSSPSVTDAGNYYAVFSDKGGSSYTVPFTVEKFDISKVSLSVDDQVLLNNGNSPINAGNFFDYLIVDGDDSIAAAVKAENSSTSFDLNVLGPDHIGMWYDGAGEYKVTITVNAPAGDVNIVSGSATVTYTVVSDSVFDKGDLKYGRQVVKNGDKLTVSLLDGESFDASKLSVVYGDKTLAGDDLEVTYEVKKDGAWKACEAADLAKQGEYQVTVRVKPFAPTFGSSDTVAGTIKFTVEVLGSVVDQDSMLGFYFDGKLVGDSVNATYDGTDQLDKVSVVVKDEDGNTLVEGTDYELKVTLDGEEVDTAVDAASDPYVIEVVPLTFKFDEDATSQWKLSLNVNQVEINRLVADVVDMKFPVENKNGFIPVDSNDTADTTDTGDNEFYVKYTGSAVDVPGVKYQVEKDGEYSYVTLDPSLYNVVSIEQGSKEVEEAVEKDTYTVTIALSDEAKSNYALDADEFEFTVREFGHFTDVASDAWYAVPVEKAYKNWYVNGIAGTDLFAPNADITRADVACILFNMAGSKNAQIGNDEFGFSEVDGYITGFDDVDGHAYYAQAIAWAHASGVVNGHDGEFRPMDKITREEFASMLANFAKVKGDYKASDGSALAGLSDAASVSDWAEANVAWAVENGIMGNGGSVNATAQITRAEVAAMAVNYQPEPLVEVADR